MTPHELFILRLAFLAGCAVGFVVLLTQMGGGKHS